MHALTPPAQSQTPHENAGGHLYEAPGSAPADTLFPGLHHRTSFRLGQEQLGLERSIIENAPLCIIATDATGKIIAMNPAAEKLTHYRSRDLIGQHSLILLHDPAELSSHAISLNESLSDPMPAGIQSLTVKARQGIPEEREWTYIRRDGTRVWVKATITALHSPAGECTGFLAVAVDINEHKQISASAHHLAMHDQLTGLPNRTLMLDRIAQSIRRSMRFGHRLALYLINLDQFERFNSSLGMAAGDDILKHVAAQLQTAVRSSDTVARIGGDEFAVMMPEIDGPVDAERCAELLQHKLSTPLYVGNREVQVSASIGICLYPDAGRSVHEMLSRAHAAMLSSKAAGRAGHQFYVASQKPVDIGRLELEEALRHALRKQELFLQYQPQVECSTGEVTGFEALLRWQNQKFGLVPPAEFIPVAEDLGIMGPISEWVFERACADCHEFQGWAARPFKVAVNLSARQFAQRELPDMVERTLQMSGLHPDHLQLEITEQMLMVNSPRTVETLKAIRELGVSIAIDDFGTGFSSFSYILDYQVDHIKIDRSFISKATVDPSAMAVTKAIIRMAHSLKMRVVAEGVETEEQSNFLTRQRCDAAQGYFFARPVCKEDFLNTLQQLSEKLANSAHRRTVGHSAAVLTREIREQEADPLHRP